MSLYKKVLFGSVSVPCMGGIGSCTYDDLCDSCPQCGCPLKAVRTAIREILITIEYAFQGDHTLALPITIDVASWVIVGNYQGEIHIKTGSEQKGCVKVSNVHIQSSK